MVKFNVLKIILVKIPTKLLEVVIVFLFSCLCGSIMEEQTLAGQLVDHLLPLAMIMMLLLMNMVCRLQQLLNSCPKLAVFTSCHRDANVFYMSLNFSGKLAFGLAFVFIVAILVSP